MGCEKPEIYKKADLFVRKFPINNYKSNNQPVLTNHSFMEENQRMTKQSKYSETNLEDKLKQTNPFANNQYNKVHEEKKRLNTNNTNPEKPVSIKTEGSIKPKLGNSSGNNGIMNRYNNPLLKKKNQMEITLKEENQKNSNYLDSLPQKTQSDKLSVGGRENKGNNRQNSNPSVIDTDKALQELLCGPCYNKELAGERFHSRNSPDPDDSFNNHIGFHVYKQLPIGKDEKHKSE
jgi:hypothetical protein